MVGHLIFLTRSSWFKKLINHVQFKPGSLHKQNMHVQERQRPASCPEASALQRRCSHRVSPNSYISCRSQLLPRCQHSCIFQNIPSLNCSKFPKIEIGVNLLLYNFYISSRIKLLIIFQQHNFFCRHVVPFQQDYLALKKQYNQIFFQDQQKIHSLSIPHKQTQQ